jgi:hypothetical protein
MVQNAPATQRRIVGFAMLALLAIPAMAAQLPDAPSAVRVAQNAAAPGQDPPSPQQGLYRPEGRAPEMGELSFEAAESYAVPGSGPDLGQACPPQTCSTSQAVMCCTSSSSDPFERYLNRPETAPLTARDKLNLAAANVFNPFNLGTIALDAAIGVASDSHSPYGPGMEGFGKYAGVSLTENMTGEFFGTFLVPAVMHQDQHYHREPFMPVEHRILHAITQVVWARSDTGRPMFNYGNIVGGIATATVSNTFVPGPNRQGFDNTAQRLALAFALSPTGNLISEFFPDIARRINLRVVIFQRILNTVSTQVSGTPAMAP